MRPKIHIPEIGSVQTSPGKIMEQLLINNNSEICNSRFFDRVDARSKKGCVPTIQNSTNT